MKHGFSLIELLVVMAIMGILAMVAYPSYQHYIVRAHRSDGQSALLDLAIRLEQFYAKHNLYQSATIGTGATTDILSKTTSPERYYTLSITRASANEYALQATPNGVQAKLDTACQSLTLNSLGAKGITSGPAGVPTGLIENCW